MDVLEEMDNLTEEWHKGNSESELHEYLGMSPQEYLLFMAFPSKWVEAGCPRSLKGAVDASTRN